MIPRWHVLWGLIFTAVVWYFSPQLSIFYIVLLFLSTFLMDFDHYANSAIKTKNLSLFKSFKYHDKLREIEDREKAKGIRNRGPFHPFHTVEFHMLVALLGLLWIGFFYIFLGMIFHSLLDLFWLMNQDRFYRREYFFFNWVRKQF
jgi:hypothetical protein